MNLVWFIYLTSMLNPIKGILATIVVISIIVGVIFMICYMDENDDDTLKQYTKNIFTCLKVAIPVTVLLIVIPNKTTAYQMLAAYGVTEAYYIASENEDVQRVAGKSLELLEKTLDEHLATEDED